MHTRIRRAVGATAATIALLGAVFAGIAQAAAPTIKASTPTSITQGTKTKPPTIEAGKCGNWSAWVDRQPRVPPGPPTLHVRGECTFRTAGITVELRRHEPQDFNTRDLLLDKIVRASAGVAAPGFTTVEVSYREDTTAGFDTVTILPDGATIDVQEVH